MAWKAALKNAHEMRIEHFYKMGQVLGEGAFAQVRIGEDSTTKEQFAIKIINKESYDVREMQFIMREVKIMMRIAHDNIVNTFDIFDSMKYLHLVIEYMQGGELFDIIADQGHLSEQRASQIIRQIIKGVEYLHDVGVVHCDIKPENILCKSKTWPLQVKLCDFGLANFYDKYSTSSMTAMIGTPGYVAPEVVQRKPYGPPVDMWACGVVLYVMLSGRMPFYGKDDIACLRMTATGEFSFPDREWKDISEDAKSLVRALLQISPEKRLTACAALQHRWLVTPQNLSDKLLENDLTHIHSKTRKKFRKAIYTIQSMNLMRDLTKNVSQSKTNESPGRSGSTNVDMDEG
ncbi:Calcium-dependent protein kinase [Chondrus crispus]|uniref:Calcium-dependent protein kinase n=1 Tax=Chondrus crispus TaxID=2769 RepID=R7QH31_CHOCR|nr:Calcium-dependent protein kinase [Chondrus crispus]CDF37384.1 Calcium-dependent protein kinase [Chondrus crispus]|eukprot:XP_005717203.1 Calcium-dependent protein kinase [Chondrus crispus]